jgi:CubicO group peptidase (beta-lactamase class C family)
MLRDQQVTLEFHSSEGKATSHRMRRREFLVESGRAAVGFSLLSAAGCSLKNQRPAQAKGETRWQTLVADLEKEIPKLMEEASVPGLSIAIIQDGKLVWRRGFGVKDSESRALVDNETVFEAGSMSKPVFAYAVMKLCEKGVMDLDTPLTKYVSERFLEGDPRLDVITARHVLAHTSGFQNWRSKDKPLKIHFTPGEQFRYSGEGYYYLQSVVTNLTGHVDPNDCRNYEAGLKVCATDFDPYMKANVLAPFGMTLSGYVWSDTFERHTARPHDRDGKPSDKKKPKAPNVARYGSAGGLHATPTDYAKFLIEVIDPKPSDAFRLKKESVEEMVRPHVKTNDKYSSSWALGWQVHHTESGNVICHGGYNTGFHSFAAASVKRKSGFVIMTNGDNAGEIIINKFAIGEMISRVVGGT